MIFLNAQFLLCLLYTSKHPARRSYYKVTLPTCGRITRILQIYNTNKRFITVYIIMDWLTFLPRNFLKVLVVYRPCVKMLTYLLTYPSYVTWIYKASLVSIRLSPNCVQYTLATQAEKMITGKLINVPLPQYHGDHNLSDAFPSMPYKITLAMEKMVYFIMIAFS